MRAPEPRLCSRHTGSCSAAITAAQRPRKSDGDWWARLGALRVIGIGARIFPAEPPLCRRAVGSA